MTPAPSAKPDLSRKYRGWVRIPPWPWECVCSHDDPDLCLALVRAVKRPGNVVDRLVSLKDPNLSERRSP